MIAGNYNQNIIANEIQNFYTKISIINIYYKFNNINMNILNNKYKNRSKWINSITLLPGISQCIKESKLLEINKIILSDYQISTIYMNLE